MVPMEINFHKTNCLQYYLCHDIGWSCFVKRLIYVFIRLYIHKCDPPREKVPPRGFIQNIYDVILNLNLMIT